MKNLRQVFSKIFIVVLFAFIVVLTGCTDATVKITLELDSNSIMKGQEVKVSTTVTGSKDQSVHLSLNNPDILQLSKDNVITVLKDVKEEIKVTVTAVANADKTVSDSKVLTVKPYASSVSIKMSADKTYLSPGETANLLVVIAGSTDESYLYEISHPELVEVENDVVHIIGNVTVDTKVTVKVIANADKSISAEKEFTIKGVKPTPAIIVSETEMTIGDEIALTVEENGVESPNYRFEVSDPELLSISEDGILTITGELTKQKWVTVTAIHKDDETIRATKEVLVYLPKSEVSITFSVNKNTIRMGEEVEISVVVTGSDNKNYTYEISDTSLISIDDGIITVIKDIKVDTLVKITVIAEADPTIRFSKSITVNAVHPDGQVGELTSQMLKDVANESITVSGRLTDYYRDLNQSANNVTYKYDMKVQMTKNNWVGAWNSVGNEDNVIVNHYTKSEDDGYVDGNGEVGHALKELYINKYNEVSEKVITDSYSRPVIWETRHFWNHLDNLNIKQFSYDMENNVYKYNFNEKDYDELLLMTYLSFSLTPLLTETLFDLYLVVEDDKVTQLIATTEIIYYGDPEKPDAMEYSQIELEFTNVGTTKLTEKKPHATPEHADKLEAAMATMRNAKNYFYKVVDTRTFSPTPNPDDYNFGESREQKDTNLADILSGEEPANPGTNIKDYQSSVGTVGSLGYVTEDAILIADTMQYDATMDGRDYKTTYHGYKQVDEDFFDHFEYKHSEDTLVGTKKVAGNIHDVLPNFDFSPNIFEFIGTSVSGTRVLYNFVLRESGLTKEIVGELSSYKYANSAVESSERRVSIVVDEAGNLVSTSYPYSIADIYIGYCNTTFSHLNNTVIDEEVFEYYIPRVYRTEWSDYTTKYYYSDDTKPSHDENTEVVINSIFGEKAKDLPTPELFMNIFGDNISGPFYKRKAAGTDSDGNTIYTRYFSITTDTDVVDENRRIANYEEIIDALTTALEAEGFKISMANTTPPGSTSGYANRYVTFVKEGVQIVIENNHTKNFWIYFYNTGDWTLQS